MSGLLHGVDIYYIRKIEVGRDPLNTPIYEENPEPVHDVLIGPSTSSEATESGDLTGRREQCQIGIPKGDTHDWTNCTVEFWGKRWRSIGFPERGIEDMVPTRWHQKVTVERIE